MIFTRADRSLVADWWFTIDRVLVGAVLLLVGIGMVLSMAASPAVAIRKGYATYHFAERHLLFALLGVALMLAVSFANPRMIRRIALATLVVSLGLMGWLLVGGPEINGARRWVRLAGHSFQPSEIAKPAFIVVTAWLFSEGAKRRDMPALAIAITLLALLAGLLILQPDIGQTMLLAMVWSALFVLAGYSLHWASLLLAGAAAALAAAAMTFSHVRSRLARFVDPSSGDTYQTDRAIQSFREGGLLGRGPGEGTIKSILPDAHTDFIFAVVGEEYGALACLALLGLFAFIAIRSLDQIWSEPDAFIRLAAAGLVLVFTLQAAINMGVNVGLLPAKGMTLPFISAGGSSNLGASLTIGMLLALLRRRPDPSRVKKPTLRPSVGAVGH